MKTEERKELQTNSLAQFLARMIEGIKAGPSRRGLMIGGIVLLAVLAFFIFRWISGSSFKKNSALWTTLYSDPLQVDDDFKRKSKGTMQGHIQSYWQALGDLEKAMRDDIYSQDKQQHEEARKKLKEAAEKLEALVKEFPSKSILVQECLLHAGLAYETLGDADRARAAFAELKKRFPDSKLNQLADAAVNRLDAAQFKESNAALGKD